MSRMRVRDLGYSTHSVPEGHGHVRVRRHPYDGLVEYISSIVSVGELPPTHRTVLVLHFRETSMIFCPRRCTSPGVMDSWRVG